MQRPTWPSAASIGRFALVALGFAFGLCLALTNPYYRHAPLWSVWAPLQIALTTAAAAAFPYGLRRWTELRQLVNEDVVRVRDVVSRIAAVGVVTLLISVAATLLPAPLGIPWRGVALLFVVLFGSTPAAGVMEGVRHAAGSLPESDNKGQQVTKGQQVIVLIGLRELLQRLLGMLGALVALGTFTLGAGNALQRSTHGVAAGAPPQLVLIVGGVGSLLVALFYVPAATALHRGGQSLCKELFPLHEAKEASAILRGAEDRRKLEQLLGIDRGVVADLQTGLAILGPLLGSAAAAFLSP